MRKTKKRWIYVTLALCMSVIGLCIMWSKSVQAANYPDEVLLGAFWESDEDNTDTLYWSLDGVNFYELTEAYTDDTPNSSDSAHVQGAPDYVSTLHDPSIIYKDNYFWMLSGYTDSATSRFVPMIGYSNDLVHWSYPNSGSQTNIEVKGDIPGQELWSVKPKYDGTKGWDTVAPDFMIDDDGTVWITVCVGYYGQFHVGGSSAEDVMQPYLIKATGLAVPSNGDPVSNPGAQPVVTYSDAVPINLPSYTDVTINNRIDSSLYKEGDYYYLLVKKEGVTIEIWRTKNLSLESCQNSENWELVCDDAVTGFEGPCLTKFQGQYFLYTDKLADYPPDSYDGKRGVHVSLASIGTTGRLDEWTGWLESNQHKIVGHAADGTEKECRHGTVITVTDPNAIRVIWDLRAQTRYNNVQDEPLNSVAMGWYIKESYQAPRYGSQNIRYWYEYGVRQGVRLLANGAVDESYRGKEIADTLSPDESQRAWYWLDNDNKGAMASSKDVYLPSDKEEYNRDEAAYEATIGNPDKWKWVRYDENGKMIHGEDHRSASWNYDADDWAFWYFDLTTGAMQFGLTEIPNGDATKWVYYDDTTGQMLYGYHRMNGSLYYFDEHDGTAIDGWYPDAATGELYWYERGERQGYRYVVEDGEIKTDLSYRGKEIWDPTTDGWYWLDNVQQGAIAKSKDVFQTSYAGILTDSSNGITGKWVRYNEYGSMYKNVWDQDSATGKWWYFELQTGAMAKGELWINSATGEVSREAFAGAEHWIFDKTTGLGERID